MKRLAIMFAAMLISSTAAKAQRECGNIEVPFMGGSFGLATETSTRSYFFDDNGHKTASYVVRGDQVLTGNRDGDYICAQYQSRAGDGGRGWIKSADLTALSSKPLSASMWYGKWIVGKSYNLAFKKGSKPDWLSVVGEGAHWAMDQNTSTDEPMYTGGVDGEAPLVDGTMGFTQTDDRAFLPYDEKASDSYKCAVRFRILSSRYIVAEDSGNCGGAHIRFSGLYVKAK